MVGVLIMTNTKHEQRFNDASRIGRSEVKKGDVLLKFCPFEENTRDYYNGYTVEEIIGNKVLDRNGKDGKTRPILVLDIQDYQISYIPLTSKYNSNTFDVMNLYKLQDTNLHSDNYLATYAQLDVRVIKSHPEATHVKVDTLTPRDLSEVTSRLNERAFAVRDGIDSRALMSESQMEMFRNRLEIANYSHKSFPTGVNYYQENRRFTLYNSGLVHYHFQKDIEDVRQCHKPISTNLTLNNLTKAINDLTNSLNAKER